MPSRLSPLLPAARQGLALAACLAGLALAAPPASPLPDPTRPPAALLAALAASAAGRGARPAEAAAAPASAPVAEPLPLLQGLHLPANGAPTAMLDGRLLKVGEHIGQRTVIGIDRQGVTLRGPGGTARVRLLGDNTRQPAGSILIGRASAFTPAGGSARPLAAGDAPADPTPTPEPSTSASDPAAAVSLAGKHRP